MALKLKSVQQTFETFLGSYWVHRNQYTPKKEKQRKNIVDPKMVKRFPTYSKTVVITQKDMVFKLMSVRKTFDTFLGSYWVHRKQYTITKAWKCNPQAYIPKRRTFIQVLPLANAYTNSGHAYIHFAHFRSKCLGANSEFCEAQNLLQRYNLVQKLHSEAFVH